MAQFEFFFAFYGLLLGLAVAELLQGVGSVMRARRIRSSGLQILTRPGHQIYLCAPGQPQSPDVTAQLAAATGTRPRPSSA